MRLNRQAKGVARALLHQAGWLRGFRCWNRQGIRILMYHDFPSAPGLQDALAKQCAHITRYYKVVSLTDIGRHLREGTPLPKNALAVTVDDGNRDFLLNGYPVFRAHKIPVTVFLVSGFLDGQLWLWWDKIIYAVEKSRRSSFAFPLSPGQPAEHFFIETPEQRQHAIMKITEALKALSMGERLQVLNGDLAKILDVELPNEPPPHMAPMKWSEVRHLMENGVDVGAHTVTHPVLARIRDPQELFREIGGCKRRIEEELRRAVLHFCYPYGCWSDFNDQTLKVLEECRFHTAVTAERGLNYRDSHAFKLRRIPVDPATPEFYFQELLAGLHLESHES
jgi:peptidoglycan/xylan/chitin deacetylase (PgdA/CDA1 family)